MDWAYMQNYQVTSQAEKTELDLISVEINTNPHLDMKKILKVATNTRGNQ
jgi:hypothetical protein